jgi:hypothetical protein
MNIKSLHILFLLSAACLLSAVNLFASEKSEAAALMKQCDDGVKLIGVPLNNFGDSNDMAKFNEGLDLIKLGKAKLAQAKYADAKAQFNKYLDIQNDLYKSLADKYIKRTQDLIDEISVDLADFVSDSYVLEAFTKANHYLDAAKTQVQQKKYDLAVTTCRRSKKFLFDIYIKMKSALPDKYKKDSVDINNELYK